MQILQQFLTDFGSWWTPDRILEALGFLTGLFYIDYEYHANAKVWIATIIMPAISIWVYFRAGIYADFGSICFCPAECWNGKLIFLRQGLLVKPRSFSFLFFF